MASVVSWVWHGVHDKESRERKGYRESFGKQCNQGLWTFEFWFAKWRCVDVEEEKESD